MLADSMIDRCNKLKSKWATRNRKFKIWYDILKLKDELQQDGMESVTSNDPRTGYNLGRHLLKSSHVAHRIDQEELDANQVAATSYFENYITKRWLEHEQRYRRVGKQGWLWYLTSWLMASGWYAVWSMVDENRIWSEVWSPAETFPDFSDDGLVEVVHEYPLSPAAAALKIKKMGWQYNGRLVGTIILRDHWGFDLDGDVANSIILGREYVKEPSKDVELSKIGRLPVFISPVGGLPDIGSIDTNNWQEHFGESIVAVNEELTKNYNKMLTYTQQLMRDTANPRWLELSSSDEPILKPENLFKRGAIFRGAPGETVSALPMPAIPVELRQMMFDYQNMFQRGMFNWTTFGNIQQQMSYLAMANVAASSMQVLSPYIDAMAGLLADLDNYWKQMILENGFKPYKFKLPSNLPDEFEFEVQADIEVPGYLVQRATVARMLDPTFRISTNTVMNRLFPEIKSAIREQANVRKDVAMNNPKAIMVDSILAYREQARLMREARDEDGAILYDKLADSLEQELTGQTQQEQPTNIPKSILPQEIQQPRTGMEQLGEVT